MQGDLSCTWAGFVVSWVMSRPLTFNWNVHIKWNHTLTFISQVFPAKRPKQGHLTPSTCNDSTSLEHTSRASQKRAVRAESRGSITIQMYTNNKSSLTSRHTATCRRLSLPGDPVPDALLTTTTLLQIELAETLQGQPCLAI